MKYEQINIERKKGRGKNWAPIMSPRDNINKDSQYDNKNNIIKKKNEKIDKKL